MDMNVQKPPRGDKRLRTTVSVKLYIGEFRGVDNKSLIFDRSIERTVYTLNGITQVRYLNQFHQLHNPDVLIRLGQMRTKEGRYTSVMGRILDKNTPLTFGVHFIIPELK